MITDAEGNTLDSAVATITLKGDPIVITEQPTDVVDAEVGQVYNLHVGAEGEGLTYRWKLSTDGGETWGNTTAIGYKTATLKVTVRDYYNGYKYYCVITDAEGNTLDSAEATITLKRDPIVITEQPTDVVDAEVGVIYNLHVEAEGTGLKYRWKLSTDGGETWGNTTASGYATSTVKVKVRDYYNGYKYYCVITDAEGNTLDSAVVTITLKRDPIVITEQPADVVDAEVGQVYNLHVGAEGEGLTYRWKLSTDGGETWGNTTASGYKTSTLKVTVRNYYDGYKYYCEITDTEGNILNSDVATITLALNDGVFTYALNDAGDGLVVTAYLLNESSVTVPETFRGYTVKEIGACAFENKTTIVSVDLPDTITVIRRRAFAGCTNLRDMH